MTDPVGTGQQDKNTNMHGLTNSFRRFPSLNYEYERDGIASAFLENLAGQILGCDALMTHPNGTDR